MSRSCKTTGQNRKTVRTGTSVFVSALLTLMGTSAYANDVDQQAAALGWSGFYVGAAVGAGGTVHQLNANLGGPTLSANGIGGEGVLGSLFLGYDYQVSPRFVLGAMVDFTASNIATTLNGSGGGGPTTLNFDLTADRAWNVMARAGYLSGPDTLIYALAGYSHQNYSASLTVTNPAFATSYNFDQSGFVLGAGIENRISSNLSARLEYRYNQYNSVGIIPPFLSAEPSAHTIRLGLAYKFGAGEHGDAPDHQAIGFEWTGFSIGANLGAGMTSRELGLNAAPFLSGSFNGIGAEGGLLGINVGYDHQISNDWVVGLHAGYNRSFIESELSVPGFFTAKIAAQNEFSVIGRAGWLATPDTLWYGLAGYSLNKAEVSATGVGTLLTVDNNGWLVGGGVETALTENLTAGLEYRYKQSQANNFAGGFISATPSSHTAMFKLNYKFRP